MKTIMFALATLTAIALPANSQDMFGRANAVNAQWRMEQGCAPNRQCGIAHEYVNAGYGYGGYIRRPAVVIAIGGNRGYQSYDAYGQPVYVNNVAPVPVNEKPAKPIDCSKKKNKAVCDQIAAERAAAETARLQAANQLAQQQQAAESARQQATAEASRQQAAAQQAAREQQEREQQAAEYARNAKWTLYNQTGFTVEVCDCGNVIGELSQGRSTKVPEARCGYAARMLVPSHTPGLLDKVEADTRLANDKTGWVFRAPSMKGGS